MESRPLSLLSQLKSDTAFLHEQIERTLDADRRFKSIDPYRKLIVRFLGFYRPVEALITSHLANEDLLELGRRRKTALLIDDLRALGIPQDAIDDIPVCAAFPDIETPAQALGCMYVLEGATLGGKLIRRQLASHLNLEPGTGSSFFASYGDDTGPMWKRFCSFVTQYETAHKEECFQIVSAAKDTFEKFEQWIAEGDRS